MYDSDSNSLNISEPYIVHKKPPMYKWYNDKNKIYKIINTKKFRASGDFGELGISGISVTSQMLEIQAGTEVIIDKLGVNSSHPDICRVYVPSMDVYLEAVSMIRELDDQF